MAKIDRTLLTATEAREYDGRIRTHGDASKLPNGPKQRLRILAVGSLIVTGLAALAAFGIGFDRGGVVPATGFGFGAIFGLGCIFGIVYTFADALAVQRWARAYLGEIGYHGRTERPGTEQRPIYDDDDYSLSGGGRTYPVTDGRYDPDLYAERGGYATYRAMDAWNIDDYDVYKSNIE